MGRDESGALVMRLKRAITGDADDWDLNYVMYPGESLTSNGIKVTLVKGGDNDTVRIEKVG